MAANIVMRGERAVCKPDVSIWGDLEAAIDACQPMACQPEAPGCQTDAVQIAAPDGVAAAVGAAIGSGAGGMGVARFVADPAVLFSLAGSLFEDWSEEGAEDVNIRKGEEELQRGRELSKAGLQEEALEALQTASQLFREEERKLMQKAHTMPANSIERAMILEKIGLVKLKVAEAEERRASSMSNEDSRRVSAFKLVKEAYESAATGFDMAAGIGKVLSEMGDAAKGEGNARGSTIAAVNLHRKGEAHLRTADFWREQGHVGGWEQMLKLAAASFEAEAEALSSARGMDVDHLALRKALEKQGRAFQEMDHRMEAVSAYDRALAASSSVQDKWRRALKAADEGGRRDEAQFQRERLAEEIKASADLLSEIGTLRSRMGDRSEAIELFETSAARYFDADRILADGVRRGRETSYMRFRLGSDGLGAIGMRLRILGLKGRLHHQAFSVAVRRLERTGNPFVRMVAKNVPSITEEGWRVSLSSEAEVGDLMQTLRARGWPWTRAEVMRQLAAGRGIAVEELRRIGISDGGMARMAEEARMLSRGEGRLPRRAKTRRGKP